MVTPDMVTHLAGKEESTEEVGYGGPFTLQEIELAIMEMKTETAPGPDGFPVIFCKKIWGLLKGMILAMMNDFWNGTVDLFRLNYGVLTLLPKVKGAVSIKQFRPIALINVSFKISTKLLTNRLTPVAQRIISTSQ